MDTKLTVEYDAVGDILYLGRMAPYPEQDSEEIDYGVVARMNPQSHDVENVEGLFFSKRLSSGGKLELPITADLRLAA